MSKCSNTDTRFFKAPNAGVCDICHPCDTMTKLEATAMCPPIGEPKCLTMMAPVVFDEAGINLCRVFAIDDLLDVCERPSNRTTDILFDGLTKCDLENANTIQLHVVDIDFNFICPETCRFSEIRPSKNTPNLSRIVLRDIDVTLSVSIMDSTCRVCKEGMLTLRYLPSENCPGFSEETNPSNIAFDLYTPYGISYAPENPAGCNKLVPTINFIGLVEGQHCQNCDCPEVCHDFHEFEANNSLRQGISAQALAKVIAKDDECMAVGITLYFKAIYFVQYKFQHEGLVVPPKFLAASNTEESSCKIFCEGDLLEPCIQPLDVAERPKCFQNTCNCNKKC